MNCVGATHELGIGIANLAMTTNEGEQCTGEAVERTRQPDHLGCQRL